MRHRPASTEKIIDDLIQHRDGIELPAGGAWTIAPGQSMWAERLGPGRARRIGLRTASGALTVSTDLVKLTLTLGLVARDGTATPRTIGFEGDLGFADRVGRWRFDGRSTVDGASSACVLALDYQGVHARGATPVAWLTGEGAAADRAACVSRAISTPGGRAIPMTGRSPVRCRRPRPCRRSRFPVSMMPLPSMTATPSDPDV